MNDILKNLESPENITNNDWRTVEKEIKYLYEMIKGIEVGATSFESITGLPEDNVALRAVLDGKASEVDLQTLQGLVETLQTAVSNVYTKTEVDNLLDDKADVGDSYTKAEDDALLDGKVDKETGKELMPSTLPDRVSQNESDIQDLKDNKQDKMQFTEMPNPYTYLGKIVQYVGPTNTQYTNGLFYQGDYDSASLQYIWQPIGTSKGPEYEAGQGIEITDNVIKCTLLNDTLTSTLTTWSSQKLRQEFESIAGATKVYIVPELPTQGELNAIYYQGTEAPYNIYLYSSTNEWVLIGTTGVNLQNYYTKTEVDNLINTYKPASGAGTIVAGSQQGMRVNILCDNPLSIDNTNQHLKLNYNEGLDVNNNGQLKVNIGDGLKLNGSNNTIEPDVDNSSVILDTNNKISVPLKTINGTDLHGSGNITTPAYDDFFAKVGEEIMYSGPIIGYLAYNSTRYMTCLTFFKSLKNITNLRIKKLDVALRDNGGYLKYHAVIGDSGINTGASFPIIDNYTEQKTGITADGYKTGSENQWWLNINLDQASRITTTLTGNPPVTNTPLMFMFANCVFECI